MCKKSACFMNWPNVPEIQKLSELSWSQKNNTLVQIPRCSGKKKRKEETNKEKKKRK